MEDVFQRNSPTISRYLDAKIGRMEEEGWK
jgi:hypothetical protein